MNFKYLVAILSVLASSMGIAFPPITASGAETPRQIDWKTLLPATERDNYTGTAPSAIHDYLGEYNNIAALQTGSFNTNPELDGALIRIPGFVVPLQSNAAGQVNEFFLVPYFGACIHVPPPPPNQIVFVKMRAGAALHSIEDAQWITGRLHTKGKNSPLGAAAYTLDGEKMEMYKY